LHFCYYLHFEEDLVLYLNDVEFPLLKDGLYDVWGGNPPADSGEDFFF
jgi:hypothetical protein